jgi:prefoldin alpha subunit
MVNNVDQVDPREVQMLQMYLNEYGQQMEILSQQLNLIEQQRLESLAAVETIQMLEESGDGEVLLPIGGGAVVRAKVLDIGADVVVEHTSSDAVEYLQDRNTELDALGKKVAGSIEQVRGQVNEISRRLEAVYRQRGQPPRPGQGGQ